ncbi:MAG: hypothetical protein KVP17_001242 [Porospora cf. gigantea B]|uniref:uncharacterized protein n=1 Tax=Porospora cf. gigantea B TaxID=2853592 RepID=UPI003571B6B1|nr:MAG: hypothetical protein KVP17_001242 [Porospora cf. gigantea B]
MKLADSDDVESIKLKGAIQRAASRLTSRPVEIEDNPSETDLDVRNPHNPFDYLEEEALNLVADFLCYDDLVRVHLTSAQLHHIWRMGAVFKPDLDVRDRNWNFLDLTFSGMICIPAEQHMELCRRFKTSTVVAIGTAIMFTPNLVKMTLEMLDKVESLVLTDSVTLKGAVFVWPPSKPVQLKFLPRIGAHAHHAIRRLVLLGCGVFVWTILIKDLVLSSLITLSISPIDWSNSQLGEDLTVLLHTGARALNEFLLSNSVQVIRVRVVGGERSHQQLPTTSTSCRFLRQWLVASIADHVNGVPDLPPTDIELLNELAPVDRVFYFNSLDAAYTQLHLHSMFRKFKFHGKEKRLASIALQEPATAQNEGRFRRRAERVLGRLRSLRRIVLECHGAPHAYLPPSAALALLGKLVRAGKVRLDIESLCGRSNSANFREVVRELGGSIRNLRVIFPDSTRTHDFTSKVVPPLSKIPLPFATLTKLHSLELLNVNLRDPDHVSYFKHVEFGNPHARAKLPGAVRIGCMRLAVNVNTDAAYLQPEEMCTLHALASHIAPYSLTVAPWPHPHFVTFFSRMLPSKAVTIGYEGGLCRNTLEVQRNIHLEELILHQVWALPSSLKGLDVQLTQLDPPVPLSFDDKGNPRVFEFEHFQEVWAGARGAVVFWLLLAAKHYEDYQLQRNAAAEQFKVQKAAFRESLLPAEDMPAEDLDRAVPPPLGVVPLAPRVKRLTFSPTLDSTAAIRWLLKYLSSTRVLGEVFLIKLYDSVFEYQRLVEVLKGYVSTLDTMLALYALPEEWRSTPHAVDVKAELLTFIESSLELWGLEDYYAVEVEVVCQYVSSSEERPIRDHPALAFTNSQPSSHAARTDLTGHGLILIRFGRKLRHGQLGKSLQKIVATSMAMRRLLKPSPGGRVRQTRKSVRFESPSPSESSAGSLGSVLAAPKARSLAATPTVITPVETPMETPGRSTTSTEAAEPS